MDKKDLIITFLGLFVIILLVLGGYFVYSSLERELVSTKIELNNTKYELANTKNELAGTKNDLSNTKLDLSKSQGDTRALNAQITEMQKNSDDLKSQLEEAKEYMNKTREANLHLASQIRTLHSELMALRVSLVKQGYNDLPQPAHPILSPVSFDTSLVKPQRVQGVAKGPLGEGIDGTFINGVSWTVGIKGRALAFNGVNQYISLGNIYQDGYSNFSIACWVKHPRTSWQNIVERGSWDASDGLGLMMDYSGQSVDFGHYNNAVRSKAIVQDDQWHFIVGTMAPEGNNYIFSIYVDGKLDNTSISPVGLDATTKPWAIGARYNGSWLYHGLIEDVRFYNRTLSAAEISNQYNQ